MTDLDVDIAFHYRQGPGIACSWRHAIEDARVTVLLGASGSGKTTILRCLAGLERPQQGHIRIGNACWFDSERRLNVPPERREIGFLFQDYALFPHLTVAQNITFSSGRLSQDTAAKRVQELVEVLRLHGLEDRFPRQLSGGQQQRVALARAVFRRPRLLLLDEPLSALDRPTREEVREELRSLIQRLGVATYIVSHDRIDALTLAERTVLVDRGRIIQSGLTQQVFDRPATAAAARLVGVDSILVGPILAVDDGLATVAIGTQQVRAEAPAGAGHDAALCIRAEDVVIARTSELALSSINRWRAIVLSETPEGPFVRIGLDCGFKLSALVTRDAWARLAVGVGEEVWALVKAATIRALPRN